jgi:hypothetical protein
MKFSLLFAAKAAACVLSETFCLGHNLWHSTMNMYLLIANQSIDLTVSET